MLLFPDTVLFAVPGCHPPLPITKMLDAKSPSVNRPAKVVSNLRHEVVCTRPALVNDAVQGGKPTSGEEVLFEATRDLHSVMLRIQVWERFVVRQHVV